MKVFSPPDEIKEPEFTPGKFDLAKEERRERRYIAELTEYVKSLGYTGPLTGEEFTIPWADGAARYLVLDAPRNCALMHLPLGDAWDVPAYMTRGVRKADVVAQINNHKKFSRAFKESKQSASGIKRKSFS